MVTLVLAGAFGITPSAASDDKDELVSSADIPGPVLRGRPDNPSVQAYNRAVKLSKKNKFPAALKNMEKAFKASRFSEETIGLAYSNLCLIHYKIGNDEEAVEACKMALIWLPNYVPATLNMARVQARIAAEKAN